MVSGSREQGNMNGEATSPRALWSHIFGDLRGLLALESYVRRGDKLEPESRRYFDYPGDLDAAEGWAIARSDAGREVYFCAHLLTDQRRIKENAAPILSLWADADGATWEKASAVVQTSPGNGQVFVRLDCEIDPEEAERLNHRLTDAMGADCGGWARTKLLRVPGTRNHKYPDRPRVEIASLDPLSKVSPVELDHRLPPVHGTNGTGDRRTSVDDPPVKLTGRGLDMWYGRTAILKENGPVDRSRTLMSIGRYLYEAGAERPVIVPALEERDRSLSFDKYTGRPGEYDRIVDELEREGRNGSGSHREASGDPQYAQEEAVVRREKISDEELFEGWRERNPYVRASMKTWVDYGPGFWVEQEEEGIRHDIWREVRRRVKNPTARRTDTVFRMARDELYLPSTVWDQNPDILVLRNGTLEIREEPHLRDHSPEDYALSSFDVDFDEKATAPTWEEKVLGRLSPGEADFLGEYLGYCLTPDTSLEKAIWLLGEPGSGRSTFLEPIEAMFGERSTVVSLRAMTERFGLSNLPGKMLLMAREQPAMYLPSTDILNSIVSGETIDIDVKNKQPFKHKPTAKILWAMNVLPSIRGISEGLFRRVYVVQWPDPVEDPDPKLKAYLVEHELPGILNWAIEGLKRLRERGGFAPRTLSSRRPGNSKRMPMSWVSSSRTVVGSERTWNISRSRCITPIRDGATSRTIDPSAVENGIRR